MAESAVAGALRIDLSMGTAQFEQGTKKAENLLDRFASKMGVTAGAAAAAGTLIGTYLVRGVMAARTQINGAIKDVDDMNDAALRVGVAIEKFSALAFAAKMSGGDIQSLEQAFRGLSNKMDDAARFSSGLAARAFNALGVEVKDAEGKLRDADQVLLDLATTFSKMNDGPQKTALAVDLFTRSGGAMIQMLNEGKVGIEKFMAQAEALGLVVTKKTAAAMAKWMDDTDKLNLQLEGLWRTIASNVIPMVDSLAIGARRAALGFHGLLMETGAAVELMKNLATMDPSIAWLRYLTVMDQVSAENKKISAELEASIAAISTLPPAKRKTDQADLVIDDGKSKAKEKQLTIEQLFTAEMEKQNAAAEYNNSIKEIELQQVNALNEARYLTLSQFAQLDALLLQGQITAQQFGDIMAGVGSTMDSEFERAADNVVSNLKRIEHMFANLSDASASQWLSMGDVMIDTLGKVFGESKEFAIAETVINTAQAIMKTMASLPFPANVAAAAAVGAMGAAQIAKIASTNKGGGGGKASAAIPGGAAAAAAPAQGSPQTLFVQGINQNDLYSGDMVRSLAEKLLAYQRDGGKVVLAGGS